MKLSSLFLALAAVAACTAPPPPENVSAESSAALAGGAIAATVWQTGGIGVRVRAAPSIASAQIGSLAEGERVTVTCQVRGQMVEGVDLWDFIASEGGYVLDKYLYTGFDGFVPGAKRCEGDEAPPAVEPSGAGLASIWGGVEFTESQGFDQFSGLGLYDYGRAYGLNGSNHTGIDIMIPFGTPLFAPADGTVRCIGRQGPGTAGGGCGFFNDFGDAFGGVELGIGRIELELDDGTAVILGHSRTATVAVGQRVAAGTRVGTSGGMNGAHVHVEVRVRSNRFASGFALVDPRSVLGQ